VTESTDRGETTLTLHELIRSCMKARGWSYTDLARRSGQALTRGRWQQLGSGVRLKNFPDPASLQVIAQALEVDITTVVLGAAQAVGLDARLQSSDLAHLLPERTERLSPRMRDAILTLIRSAVADSLAGPGGTGADEQPEAAG
jgi:transcriptional regulator with XRE-family HTH domain